MRTDVLQQSQLAVGEDTSTSSACCSSEAGVGPIQRRAVPTHASVRTPKSHTPLAGSHDTRRPVIVGSSLEKRGVPESGLGRMGLQPTRMQQGCGEGARRVHHSSPAASASRQSAGGRG